MQFHKSPPKITSLDQYVNSRLCPKYYRWQGSWSARHNFRLLPFVYGLMKFMNDGAHASWMAVEVWTVHRPLCVGRNAIFVCVAGARKYWTKIIPVVALGPSIWKSIIVSAENIPCELHTPLYLFLPSIVCLPKGWDACIMHQAQELKASLWMRRKIYTVHCVKPGSFTARLLTLLWHVLIWIHHLVLLLGTAWFITL